MASSPMRNNRVRVRELATKAEVSDRSWRCSGQNFRFDFVFPRFLLLRPLSGKDRVRHMRGNEPDIITIQGAREHNLQNITLTIPRNQLVVFTGVSGSGKSSLAFDTLYAEGQRRYVESLSSYARQFLGQMEKPQVDYIGGLSPAIAIEQKTASTNPRSTVGTVTEIYDYLRVLFARVGTQHCPSCGDVISSQTPEQMVNAMLDLPVGSRIMILAPLVQQRKGEHKDLIDSIRQQGFVRARVDGRLIDLDEELVLDKRKKHSIEVVVDRLIADAESRTQITDSVETALRLSDGILIQHLQDEGAERLFSEHASCLRCGISFDALSPQIFSFNNPKGMCTACGGLGTQLVADPKLIIPDPSLSLRQGAVAVWGDLSKQKGNGRLQWLQALANHYKFDLDTPFAQLPQHVRDLLLFGSGEEKIPFKWAFNDGEWSYNRPLRGLVAHVLTHYLQTTSENVRRTYSRYIREVPCSTCLGKKLNPAAQAVRVAGRGICELAAFPISELIRFFDQNPLDAVKAQIAKDLLREIRGRLSFLMNVGLHYLTLDRGAPSLSGGESQRIRLASQIGSGLVGVLYILDEPSVGLHQRDNERLLRTLKSLRDMGNTVLVVEHDRDIIVAADHLVDFGPGAGHRGGQIVAQGTPSQLMRNRQSLTGAYLSGRRMIDVPCDRRPTGGRWLRINGAKHHNLKNIDVAIPLGVFTCVTGVSGSGKSSLINDILYKSLAARLNYARTQPGEHRDITGAEYLDKVVDIDQRPIGRTPRSNPATYIKVFDPIRQLFAKLPQAQIRGYKAARFSFNVKGGRCETCQGAGVQKVEMHFLPDVFITCEECRGYRFNRETLEVKYRNKSIRDVLDLEAQEALELFRSIPSIKRMLQTLCDVGLEYIKLGQAATTLSGGEAQRVKLARELSRSNTGKTIYILDEPTTGLHFADVEKLLLVLDRLVKSGSTVVVIEHNLEVIKMADYIIDLGPEGGEEGGTIVATGTPEQLASDDKSFTGIHLRSVLRGE